MRIMSSRPGGESADRDPLVDNALSTRCRTRGRPAVLLLRIADVECA